MQTETILTEDQIVRVKTTVTTEPRRVDFNDIARSVEYDEWFTEAPWETCDGFEHRAVAIKHYLDSGIYRSHKHASRSVLDGGSVIIEIDDETVIGWGCTGPSGCSKQVRAEAIAAAKRKATETIVNWYVNGWEYYSASAEYGDYDDHCGGIDCPDYAEDVAIECAFNVAACMEKDGYIVFNKPEPTNPYDRIKAKRRQIRYNLTGVWSYDD